MLLCVFQWAVVGDTFPVGCKFQNSIVFRNSTFEGNPDVKNPTLKYSTTNFFKLKYLINKT